MVKKRTVQHDVARQLSLTAQRGRLSLLAEQQNTSFFKRHQLILILSLLLSSGFLITSVMSFYVSRASILDSILKNELPLTTDNIYSDIQRDVIRPVFTSSMMASDTFLRDWMLSGEKQPELIHKYLADIRRRSKVFTSFLVSEKTRYYYYGNGQRKKISAQNPADDWYFRVREIKNNYELNVDHDLKLSNNLIVFVNYRIFDYNHHYIGATGVGIAVDDMQKKMDDYQKKYQRNTYFVDSKGMIVLSGDPTKPIGLHVQSVEGLKDLLPLFKPSANFVEKYRNHHVDYLVNVRYVPDLKWYLVVEKNQDEAIAGIRRTLLLNILICILMTSLVIGITQWIIRRYQQRIEYLFRLDGLTKLPNRAAFEQAVIIYREDSIRQQQPLSLLMIDLDFFKKINDRYGHLGGDFALKLVADLLAESRRSSDFICRWGGEGFLVLLKNCSHDHALIVAEKIRQNIAAQVATYDGGAFHLTASIGVATLVEAEALPHWLSRADQYLYEAKRLGRNRVVGEVNLFVPE